MKAAWQRQKEGKVITRPRICDKNRTEILPDLNFSHGFQVSLFHSNSSAGRLAGFLDYVGQAADGAPCWQLSQWGCTHDLAKAAFSRNGSVMRYDDGGKCVTVDVANAQITLSIKGSEEYPRDREGRVRERVGQMENWPHLLAEQTEVNFVLPHAIRHLYMSLDYEVTHCETLVDRNIYPENVMMHAGMFVWFLHLTDIDPESVSYLRSMWFGVKMYDTRFCGRTPAAEAGYDTGKEDSTGLFIFIPSLEEVARQQGSQVTLPSSVIGRRSVVRFDALPFLEKALMTARSMGAMAGARVEGLRIDSTNIGWELMGNNDAEVRIYSLDLIGETEWE